MPILYVRNTCWLRGNGCAKEEEKKVSLEMAGYAFGKWGFFFLRGEE
jgi:hypothetical protein